MLKNFHKNKYNSGTTLIELLVVIFIFMIITNITIFNYGKFNSSLSIQNLADDVALTVRRAQSYAIGVRGYGDFDLSYGIHFTTNPNISDLNRGSNKSFILFADKTNDEDYDYNGDRKCGEVSSSNECIEMLNILSSDEIKEIKLSDGSIVQPLGSVDVMFRRPNPEPTFCYRITSGVGDCDREDDISSIKIKIANSGNADVFKVITVSNNGLISVSNNEN